MTDTQGIDHGEADIVPRATERGAVAASSAHRFSRAFHYGPTPISRP